MTLLLDTNVIVDVLAEREPFFREAAAVWKLCETKQVEGFISALSFANITYVLRKELSPYQIEEVLKILGLIFDIAGLGREDLTKAAQLHWSDYEDALQYETAVRVRAEYIITRNTKDFEGVDVTAITPENFLKAIAVR